MQKSGGGASKGHEAEFQIETLSNKAWEELNSDKRFSYSEDLQDSRIFLLLFTGKDG